MLVVLLLSRCSVGFSKCSRGSGVGSGLSESRKGYKTSADIGGRVDKRIEAKSSVPYMGTWDGRSQWCNRLSEGDRYYDPNLG